MSSSSPSGKITRRYGEPSDLNKDKAAMLFDHVFANRPKPSTSQAKPHDMNGPQEPACPKLFENDISSSSGNSFLSAVANTADFEKSDDSDEEADDSDTFTESQSSTCTLNVSMTHATISDDKSFGAFSASTKHSPEFNTNQHKTGIFKQQSTESIQQGVNFFCFEKEDEEDEGEQSSEDNNEQVPSQAKRLRPERERGSTTPHGDIQISEKGYSLGMKATYNHKWISDEEDDGTESHSKNTNTNLAFTYKAEDDETATTAYANTVGPSGMFSRERKVAQTRIGDVKEARECLKSGEQDDFNDDVKYILSTILDPSSSNNLKCLSVISLAKKCVSSEFRRFFRSRNLISRTLKAVPDSPKSPGLALCVSVVVYLLSRDTTSVFVDASALRLFSQLLKLEHPNPNEECTKYSKMVMDILKEWLEKSFVNMECKKVQFDITEKTLSPSFLILESLVYICARKHREQSLQNELLSVGILQWIVSKMDKTVLRLLHEKISDEDMLLCLKILERCFRVLESATVCNEKNGAYLISHRGSALIQSCGRLISLLFRTVERLGNGDDVLKEQNITCLTHMAGLLMSLSYENELCSTKLGQMNDFLSLCVSCFTYLVPKFVRKEKQFDLIVLLCSLLVNLLERCNVNRRKLISLTVPVYDPESKTEKQEPTLKALSQLFVYHESLARSIDEELDNDLVIEDAPDDDTNREEEAEVKQVDWHQSCMLKFLNISYDGRLHRLPTELSEDEMVEAVQKAMNKASSHMEDSVLASYFALLIGCLLLQNEESVAVVKTEMKDGKLVALVEQLQRFLEFIKLTDGKKSHIRFMERIIDLLDTLDSKG